METWWFRGVDPLKVLEVNWCKGPGRLEYRNHGPSGQGLVLNAGARLYCSLGWGALRVTGMQTSDPHHKDGTEKSTTSRATGRGGRKPASQEIPDIVSASRITQGEGVPTLHKPWLLHKEEKSLHGFDKKLCIRRDSSSDGGVLKFSASLQGREIKGRGQDRTSRSTTCQKENPTKNSGKELPTVCLGERDPRPRAGYRQR